MSLEIDLPDHCVKRLAQLGVESQSNEEHDLRKSWINMLQGTLLEKQGFNISMFEFFNATTLPDAYRAVVDLIPAIKPGELGRDKIRRMVSEDTAAIEAHAEGLINKLHQTSAAPTPTRPNIVPAQSTVSAHKL